MKVLTVKQPWATLLVLGLKEYEFRSWKTNYRGKVLIHAGESIDKEALDRFKELNLEYPTKKVVGEVVIEDCLLLDKELNRKIISENNIVYGTKEREGYAWKISHAKEIKSNKEVKGKLGLWNIDDLYDII
jgi:predicted transcriptional regulator